MIDIDFDSIDLAYIQGLVARKAPESTTLEYKEKPPDNSDNGKKEFLADISSFANTAGGYILYGISEERLNGENTGRPENITGLNDSTSDVLIQRFDNTIKDGIAPRLKVRMKAIDISEQCFILVVKIPQSYSAPHMVTLGNASRFYARRASGKYPLDVHEIRKAFIESEALPERIRNFRLDRLAKIEAGETPVPLQQGPKMVLHLVPVSAFHHAVSIGNLDFDRDKIRDIQGHSKIGRLNYNFDGVFSVREEADNPYYNQLFRNGIIEHVRCDFARVRQDTSEKNKEFRFVASGFYEKRLIESCKDFIRIFKLLSVPASFYAMISMLGVRGYKMFISEQDAFNYDLISSEIDRSSLILPEQFIENYETDIAKALRPAFDMVWQSCGIEKSLNYDENGNWSVNRG